MSAHGHRSFPVILLVLLALFHAPPVMASDGVFEINQACVAGGCFTGDEPGFPVTIILGGSYVLTSNIDVRDEVDPQNVTAIVVDIIRAGSPEGTTIDLNGFRIIGPNACANTPVVSCSAVGTGVGVSTNDNRVTVRNGRILGMGGNGVRLVSQAVVEDMHIEDCGGDGVNITGLFARIVGNTITRNLGSGVFIRGTSALVHSNVIGGHLGEGMDVVVSTAYGQNVLSQNTGGNVSSGIQIDTNICDAAVCP